MAQKGTTRSHKVISLNLRTAAALGDGPNHWSRRRDFVCDWIRHQAPSIIGCQEATPAHLEVLNSQLGMPGVGENRDPEEEFGEANPIYWDPEVWQLEEAHTFWLSAHPSEPVSKFKDSCLPRIFTVAILESERERIRVINTHWDHVSVQARELSGILLRFFLLGRSFEDIAVENFALRTKEEPTIIMGDFNESPTDPGRKILKSARVDCGWELAGRSSPYPHTFHDFRGEDLGAIDGFYLSNHLRLTALDCPTVQRSDGLWLSDHHPVVGKVEFDMTEGLTRHLISEPIGKDKEGQWPSDEERLRDFLSR